MPPVRPSDVKPAPEAKAEIGHNNPPPYDVEVYNKLLLEVGEFADAGGDWLDLKTITTEEQAQHLVDFIAGSRAKLKVVEQARKDAKKPHDDAGKLVQAAYLRPKTTLETCISKAQGLLAPWMAEIKRKEQAAAEEARAKAREEEAKARQEAEAAARRNDIEGEVRAAEELKAAEKARAAAEKAPVKAQVKSASGGGRKLGLRTIRTAIIKDQTMVYRRFRDHPKVVELLTQLATADLRNPNIPDADIAGIEIETKEVPQ